MSVWYTPILAMSSKIELKLGLTGLRKWTEESVEGFRVKCLRMPRKSLFECSSLDCDTGNNSEYNISNLRYIYIYRRWGILYSPLYIYIYIYMHMHIHMCLCTSLHISDLGTKSGRNFCTASKISTWQVLIYSFFSLSIICSINIYIYIYIYIYIIII